MPQSNYSNKSINIRKTIQRVKNRIENKAERSTRAARKELEKEAHKVLELAMDYVPRDSGFLENPSHWEIIKSRDGMNRRNVFTIKPRGGLTQRVLKSGRRVTMAQYVHFIHNDTGYSIRKKSRAKAAGLGLAKFPVTSGKYVGRLFLSRAFKQRALTLSTKIRQAVYRELKR